MVSYTSFDRVIKAVDLKEADRVPVVPQITYTTARIIGIKFIDGMRNPERMADALIAGYREIGYDGIYVGWESSFNLVAESMGCKMRIGEDEIPSVAESIVKDPSDIDKVKIPDPEKDGRLPLHLRAISLVKDEVEDRVPIFRYIPGPLTLASLIRGPTLLLMELIKNPTLVHELLDLTTEASKRFGLAAVDHGANIIVIADPTASSSVVSPKMFEEFSFPYVKEILAAIKRVGAIPSLHICGKTEPILKKMSDTGAKILELDHLVDLAKAKKMVGDRVCILGNLEPSGSLLMGNPEDVENDARECIKKAAAGGGFILSSGCEIPLDAPIKNIKAMVRAAEKYGVYH